MAKSYKFGLFRLNFSKLGIGGSFGIKGLRTGTGPRGNYIRVGRKNTYYKKGDFKRYSANDSNASIFSVPHPHNNIQIPTYTVDSGDVANMVDVSSKEIIEDLEQVRKYKPKYEIMLWVGLTAIGSLVFGLLGSILPLVLISFFTVLACFVVLPTVKQADMIKGKIVLNYELEDEVAKRFSQLQQAFHYFVTQGEFFQVSVLLNQYGQIVRTSRIKTQPTLALPKSVESNVGIFALMAGKEIIYFFPDKIFVYSQTGIGVVSYNDIHISVNTITEVIGSHWKHQNKDGSRDQRHKNNELITRTALYTRLHITSSNGLNEIFDCSQSHERAMHALASSIVNMAIENQ